MLELPLTKYRVSGEENNINFDGELTISKDYKIHDLWITFKLENSVIGSFFTTETRDIQDKTRFNCVKNDLSELVLNLVNKTLKEILNKLQNKEILF